MNDIENVDRTIQQYIVEWEKDHPRIFEMKDFLQGHPPAPFKGGGINREKINPLHFEFIKESVVFERERVKCRKISLIDF